MTEKEWQAIVVELAGYYRWQHFHAYDMRRSDPGWPDLVLARPGEVIFVELKTARGRLSDAQGLWVDLLTSAGLEVHVWRPADLDLVHERLKRRQGFSVGPSPLT